MKAFKYAAPRTLAEASSLLAEHGERARILAGGTDLIVQIREGRRDVDLVVTLGRETNVDPVDRTRFENWDTVEPSERGIDGIERMRLVRDDIAARIADLLDRMQTRSS